MVRTKKIIGIILTNTPVSEFDRRISLITQSHGRISVMAKGVRRITSGRAFHLDLLNLVRAEIEQNRPGGSAVSYLRETASLSTFSGIKSRPESFSAACLISLFLERILPEESPQPQLFLLTKKTLKALNEGKNARLILTTYFLKTLRLLGHLPEKLAIKNLRPIMWRTLESLDPQFTFHARRTLGIFSKSASTNSN